MYILHGNRTHSLGQGNRADFSLCPPSIWLHCMTILVPLFPFSLFATFPPLFFFFSPAQSFLLSLDSQPPFQISLQLTQSSYTFLPHLKTPFSSLTSVHYFTRNNNRKRATLPLPFVRSPTPSNDTSPMLSTRRQDQDAACVEGQDHR